MTRKKKSFDNSTPAPAPSSDPKQPTHNLMMKDKDGGKAARVGALWTNSAGGLSLKLNRGVVLSWRDTEDCWLTVWPADEADRSYHGGSGDEVPF